MKFHLQVWSVNSLVVTRSIDKAENELDLGRLYDLGYAASPFHISSSIEGRWMLCHIEKAIADFLWKYLQKIQISVILQ